MNKLVTISASPASWHFANERSFRSQLACLALGAVFLLASLFAFASGFLSSALFPNVVSAPPAFGDHVSEVQDNSPFSRVVFLLVDALRSDFVYSQHSGFEFTQRHDVRTNAMGYLLNLFYNSLIRDGAALPFTAHVAPPTVTLPRIKAITTGSMPGFADVMGNLDQSDAAFFTSHDSWLGQLRAAGRKMVFYGDDTWLRLSDSKSPNGSLFTRSEGVQSFLTSEYTEVDLNVTRHVAGEMDKSDWGAMILHYLGVDHIGHMSGPRAPHMIQKQRQMDDVVKLIFEALETRVQHRDTFLVLVGDHGMNEDGNHGGSDTGETESALVFASPRFRTMRVKTTYECPTLPSNGTGFDYYRNVEQQDLVPTLSALLGLPVPRNSIGRTLSELQGIWPNEKSYVRVLARNAEQLWNVAHSIFDTLTAHKEEPSCSRNMSQQRTASPNQCMDSNNTAGRLAYLLASAEQQTLRSNNMQQWTKATVAYEESLAQAQQAIIKGNRSFDLTRMAAGIALCSLAMIACCCSIGTPWPSPAISVSCAFIAVAYGFALIMSTSEKNEQYFWYLVTPAWILFLAARAIRRTQDARLRYHFVWNVIRILMSHCITVCWPFLRSVIEETMFAGHKPLMWSMLIITHLWISVKIVQHTFTGIVTGVTALSLTTPLVSTAFIFKVGQEFEHAGGITSPFGIDQISLFRTLLGLTWLAATITYITVTRQRSRSVAASKLPYRLHHLLTLILMAQSRVPKLPLFICLDHQRSCLQTVLQLLSFPPPNPTDQQRNRTNDTTKPSSIYMAITILTFSHSSFFFLGGSNSISTIDLSNAFNGITTYNILTVGVLLFCANWTGPIWWSSAACSLVEESARNPTESLLGADNKDLSDSSMPTPNETDEFLQQAHRQDQPWLSYLSTMSTLMAAITLIVMIICTLQREHHTVWKLWGSKYLYSVFWVLEWHIVVSLILGSCLRALRSF